MDAAGTFFADFMTILLALQDKSVSFHSANNLDLDQLEFFKFSIVICRHRKTEIRHQQTQWGQWIYRKFICAVKKYYKTRSFENLICFHNDKNINNKVSQNTSKFHWKKFVSLLFSEFRNYATSGAHRLHVYSLASL